MAISDIFKKLSMYIYFKRFFDISFSLIIFIFMLFPMLFIGSLVLITSGAPIIYWSKRIGQENATFLMPKFRTMKLSTPELASEVLTNFADFITPFGSFLRRTSLDELPQLWCIFIGDMSFVGPRPALFNQQALIELRTGQGVHKLVPGLTGWAQISGRDMLSVPQKVTLDVEYLHCQNFWFDLKILWHTFFKVLRREGVSH